jgi:hypothetical protein
MERDRTDAEGRTAPAEGIGPTLGTPRAAVGPELPSLSGVLIGSVLFVTGGMLIFTVIGIPLGLLMFAAGLGLMLTPKKRHT